MSLGLDDPPLVGRADALAAVHRALVDGERAGVVLTGPAGVGKTRLASECLGAAAEAGYTTARVTASGAATNVPFGALGQLVPAFVHDTVEQAEVLRRATTAIAELGAGPPLVLLVDDAHLLDTASATLVHQLAVLRAAFIVVTVRSGEPASDAIRSLWGDGLAERIELGGLSLEAHAELVAAIIGGQVDTATTRRLFEITAGNPLLTRELLLAARESGLLREDGDVWRLDGLPAVAPRLADVVAARLGGLDDDERRALEVVALGEPLGLRVLDRLGLAGQIERLERLAIVRVADDARRLEVVATHPLYTEVARARLPVLRARNHRRALADCVEELGARRRGDVLRIATWRLDAGMSLEAGLALEAARQARAAYDMGLAERLARAAVDGGGGAMASHLHGRVLALQGRPDEAEVAYASAEDADELTAALIRMDRVDNLFWGIGRTGDAIAMADRARDEATDELWRDAMTIVGAGFRVVLHGLPAEGLREVEHLLESEHPFIAAPAAQLAEGALVELGRFREAIDLATRMEPLHEALGDLSMLTHPMMHRAMAAMALAEGGWLDDATAAIDLGYERSLEIGVDRVRAWYATAQGRELLWRGRAAAAVVALREARSLFRTAGQGSLTKLCEASLAIALAHVGRADEAAATLATLEERVVGDLFDGELERARAWVAHAQGDASATVAALRRAVSLSRAHEERSLEATALHDLARFGHAEETVERLDELAAVVDGPFVAARLVHARALVAGDAEALLVAAGLFEEIGSALLAAECLATAARLQAAAGDQRGAASAIRRAEAHLAGCEAELAPGLELPERVRVLRESERQVADLAAGGANDRQIAEQLHLSVRTVGNYLQRTYKKLGISSRAELAEALRALDGEES